MGKLSIALGAAALVAGMSLFGGKTQAALIPSPNGILAASRTLNPVQDVQAFYWDGRRYCWYDDGWQGPGWYVCDYGPWVTGLWWGGGYGWHGWRGGHPHSYYRDRHRDHRRDHGYKGHYKSGGYKQHYKSGGYKQHYKSSGFKSGGGKGGGGKGRRH